VDKIIPEKVFRRETIMPNIEMSRVYNGSRYTIKTSILLASGNSIYLYMTKRGLYFKVLVYPDRPGERDKILPLSKEEAIELFKALPEHRLEYASAFDTVVEETVAGRPPLYGQTQKQTTIRLPAAMMAWLSQQPHTMSETIRDLVAAEMERQNKQGPG